MKQKQVITGHRFLRHLADTGIIDGPVRRVVIDAAVDAMVVMYIEQLGKEGLLRVVTPATLEGAVKVTMETSSRHPDQNEAVRQYRFPRGSRVVLPGVHGVVVAGKADPDGTMRAGIWVEGPSDGLRWVKEDDLRMERQGGAAQNDGIQGERTDNEVDQAESVGEYRFPLGALVVTPDDFHGVVVGHGRDIDGNRKAHLFIRDTGKVWWAKESDLKPDLSVG